MPVNTHAMTSVRSRQHGLSIVEFMVGIAVGLFIVGGAVKLFVDYLRGNRLLLLETRVNQDLRAAADLVARDLRRAGYWRNATSGVFTGASAPVVNCYRSDPDCTIDPKLNPIVAWNAGSSTLTYSYAKDGNDGVDSNEQFGFRLNGGALQLQHGAANWQQVTDPTSITINSFNVQETPPRAVDLYDTCPCIGVLSCNKNQFKNPNPDTGAKGIHYDDRPVLIIRQYAISLRGTSTTDASVVRSLRETVRVRNDDIAGECPPA